MKKILLTTCFFSTIIYSYGQHKFGIKIYQNTDIYKTQYYESGINKLTNFNNVNFNRLSLAIDIDTKNNFTHEIEFLIPEISKSTDDIQFPMSYEFIKDITFDGKASSYSLRYELSKTLTRASGRFAFNLGLGVNPYYVHIEYIPNVETAFYASTKLYGLALNMTPRIKYKLSERFSMDLNIPLKIYDFRGERNMVNNPAIPIRQQITNRFNNIFLENAYTIRLGLTYRLN